MVIAGLGLEEELEKWRKKQAEEDWALAPDDIDRAISIMERSKASHLGFWGWAERMLHPELAPKWRQEETVKSYGLVLDLLRTVKRGEKVDPAKIGEARATILSSYEYHANPPEGDILAKVPWFHEIATTEYRHVLDVLEATLAPYEEEYYKEYAEEMYQLSPILPTPAPIPVAPEPIGERIALLKRLYPGVFEADAIPEEEIIPAAITTLSYWIEEDAEGFLENVRAKGWTEDTEALMKLLIPDITSEDISFFFEGLPQPETTKFAELDRLIGKLFPERDVQETIDWAVENSADFEQQIKDIGQTVDTEALVKLLYPDISTERLAQYFAPELPLYETASLNFVAGIGDAYIYLGGALRWLEGKGFVIPGPGGLTQSQVMTELGEKIRPAYVPTYTEEEMTWETLRDPEWLATSLTRAAPTFLALIGAAILAYAGGTAVAGAVGLGAFGKFVLGSMLGGGITRGIESAWEAGAVFNESIARGKSPEEADAAADQAFRENLRLAGLDAAQLAVTFFPLKGLGASVPLIRRILNRRILVTAFKPPIVGILEAGEEGYQTAITARALGDEVPGLTPLLTEDRAIGFIFGFAMGTPGSVIDVVNTRIKRDMPPEVLSNFNKEKADGEGRGLTPDQAEAKAFDAVAETPEGRASIERTLEDLKQRVAPFEPEFKEPPVLMDIPPFDTILDNILVDNWQNNLLRKAVKVPVVGKIAEWITVHGLPPLPLPMALGRRPLIARHSQAVQDIWGKAKFGHSEIIRMGEGQSYLTYWRLFHISPNPVELFGFKKRMKTKKGAEYYAPISDKIRRLTKEADGTMEHIFAHPEQYELNTQQRQYIDKFHEINDATTALMVKHGIAPETVGHDWWQTGGQKDGWMHRVVVGKFDPDGELIKVRGRPGVRGGRIGAKASFEMHRKAPTMMDGITWAIMYGLNPADSILTYQTEVFKKIADKMMTEYVAKELSPLLSPVTADRISTFLKGYERIPKATRDIISEELSQLAASAPLTTEQVLDVLQERNVPYGMKVRQSISKKLVDMSIPGVLPREKLLSQYPEVVERAVIATEELADSKSFIDRINRVIRGEKLPEQTIRAMERRFPEQGSKFRDLIKEPAISEKQLRDVLTAQERIIKNLTARIEKVKAIDVKAVIAEITARVKAEAQAEVKVPIPDEQKLIEAFRVMEFEDRLAFREAMATRLAEIGQILAAQDFELNGIREFLSIDPIAKYRGHIGKRRVSLMALVKKGQLPETFTTKEAQMLLMGRQPEVVIKGRVPRDYILDELADHFGISEQELVDRIESIYQQRITEQDLSVLVKMAEDSQRNIKRMLGILDKVDTQPEFIPEAEPGMPEPGMQQDMFGFARPVFPKGKGEVTQISMDDYAKLVEIWKKAGLSEDALPISLKLQIEGIKEFAAETTVQKVAFEVPPIKDAKARKAALEALREEIKQLAEVRNINFWQARRERAYRMEQMKQPGIGEGYIMHSFAGGRIFDQEFIDAFNKYFGKEKGLPGLDVTADIAGIQRIVKAALDLSYPLIQGMPAHGLAFGYGLTGHPVVAAKLLGKWYQSLYYQIGAFFHQDIAAAFMNKHWQTISEMIAKGSTTRAVFLFQEMAATVGKRAIAKWSEKGLLAIPGTPYQRAEVAFFMGGHYLRTTFYPILAEITPVEQHGQLASMLDLMTGIGDPRARGVPLSIRQMETSLNWFSAAYTRACLTILAHIFRGGLEGGMARRAIGGLAVAYMVYCTAVQFAVNMIEGKDEDEIKEALLRIYGLSIDPISGELIWRPDYRFASVTIGDVSYGAPGFWYGLVRLLGNITTTVQELGDREIIDFVRIMKYGALNIRDNPFLRWWYGRSSAFFSFIHEMVSGREFLGYPIEGVAGYTRWLILRHLPIWVEQAAGKYFPGMSAERFVPEEEVGELIAKAGAEIFGFRVNELYAWQLFYEKTNEYIPLIPQDELETAQKAAIAAGRKLNWAALNTLQKWNLLFKHSDLFELFESAQADSELRATPGWKAFQGRTEEERKIYYKRGEQLIERVIVGELDTRELREKWGEAGQNYGTMLAGMEKETIYQPIYAAFDRWREKGRLDWSEAEAGLMEYTAVMFAEYIDDKGDIDWEARDRAIDAYVEKWGLDYYEKIRQMYAQKKFLQGMPSALIKLADDKDKLGREYWRLPYKPISDMDEEDELNQDIPAEFYALWKEYQALKTDAEREEFIEREPDFAKDWRAEFRLKNPEDDARLALWGYGGKLQSKEAYDLVVKWGRELGIPLEQMGLGLPPPSLMQSYFELNKIVAETSGNSPEARLFKLEHPEYLAWALKQKIWTDDLADENIEALRLKVKLKGIAEDSPEYADVSRRIEAYDRDIPEPLIKTYVEWFKEKRVGYEDDWFLMDNKEFYEEMVNLGHWQERDFSKVPSREVYALYQKYTALVDRKAKLIFRHENPDLEKWLVEVKGYTPVGDRWKEEEEEKPTKTGERTEAEKLLEEIRKVREEWEEKE